MLSRVASRIYWMSRQMERAENMARILGVTADLVMFGTKEVRQQNLIAPLTPMTANGLSANGWFGAREAQSIAFFSTPGTE